LGFGLIIGPPVGSILYGNYGYEWAFYAIAILMGFNVVLCTIVIPNKLNRDSKNVERSSLMDSHEKAIQSQHNSNSFRSSELLQGHNNLKKEDITFGAILSVKESVFAYAAAMIGTFNVSFFSSFMSL
jgi:MFS family permease